MPGLNLAVPRFAAWEKYLSPQYVLDKTTANYCRNEEPSWQELIDDPIIHILMASDGISPDMLMNLKIK